jgi:transketolase
MTGFGASAPAVDLYRHFDITPEVVAANVLLNQPTAIRKD